MEALKCPNCGGNILIDGEQEYYFCPYCGIGIPNKLRKKFTIEIKEDKKITKTIVKRDEAKIEEEKTSRIETIAILCFTGLFMLFTYLVCR